MSHELIKQLAEKRANTWEQAKALLDSAAEAKRDLSAEEDQSWQRMNADLDGIDARMKSISEAEQRNADAAEAFAKISATKPDARHAGGAPVVEELRSFLRGDRRAVDVAKDVSFRDVLKSGSGANVVPTGMYGQIVQHMIASSGLLAAGPTVIETSGGDSLDVPITTAFSTGALTAEAAAIGESDPTLSKRTLTAYKYGVLVQVSRELIDDSAFDLSGFIAEQAGTAVGNALGAHLVLGTGSNQPGGLAPLASVGITGATAVAGAFTYENLIDLQASVIDPYATRGTWLMRRSTLAAIRKLKTSGGDYIWEPSAQVGMPDSLLGNPVKTDPNVDAVALSARSVLFGDISKYFVRLAGGVRFERSDEFAFNTDLVTFKCVVRGDGVLVDQTGAVKAFVGAAT